MLLCLLLLGSPLPVPAARPAAAPPLLPTQSGPDEEYQFLVGLAEKGMNELVVKEATRFLASYPRHAKAPLARYRLALALFDLGDLEGAAPHFERLAGSAGFEFAPECSIRLGQCRLAAGDLGGAAAAFTAVLESEAEYLHLPARFLLAESRFRAGDWSSAQEGYLQVLAAPDHEAYDREARYGAAWCAFRQEDFAATVERTLEFERLHPDDELLPELRFLRGEALLAAGDAAAALDAYRSVEGGPFADAALRGAGFAASRLDDPAQAAAWFGRLVEEFPDSSFRAEAALQQGIHLLRAGDAPGALAVLASGQAGDGAEALYWLGMAEAANGRHEDALVSFDRALRAEPGRELAGRIQTARGDSLYELGRLDQAAEAYRMAESDYALQAAAVASLNDGRAEEAAAIAGRLLEEYPDSRYLPAVRLVLGEALLRLDRPAEAEPAFAAALEALERPADRARALSRLGWCRYLQGDPAGAAAFFARVVEEYPDSVEVEEAAYMEGRSRSEAGDEAGARSAWSRYLDRFPEGARVSEVMFRLGRMATGSEGLARLEELVARHGGSAEAPKALYELGQRLYDEGRVDEAAAKFTELLNSWPRHALAPAAGYALAWCRYDQDRPEEAQALLPEVAAAAAAAGDADLQRSALELLVWAAQAAGDADAAFAALTDYARAGADEAGLAAASRTAAAARRDAGDPRAAADLLAATRDRLEDPALRAGLEVERCYLLLDAGDPEAAEAAVRAALDLTSEDPTAAEAAFFVGEAWFEAGEDVRAARLYTAAAAVPDCPVADRALYKLGYAELRSDRPEPAAAAFARLISEHPTSELVGESLFLQGEALFRLGRYPEAIEPLRRLRAELPQHEAMDRCLFRLGLALCQVESWQEAADVLAELARRYPDFANGVEGELWRGRALAALDQDRAARQAFERVLARDRGVLAARARLGLGKLALASEDLEGALSEFLKVAVLYAHDDEVAEGLWYAGLCLERLGDADRAAEQYREILRNHSDTPFAARAGDRLRELESSPR
ncbi:MAG: hypothetical protein D6702_10700 [Planctomycetota bacterium]|nr:MAG: hypothetical protein D6702_10700 [Planctomycetota bacterium]